MYCTLLEHSVLFEQTLTIFEQTLTIFEHLQANLLRANFLPYLSKHLTIFQQIPIIPYGLRANPLPSSRKPLTIFQQTHYCLSANPLPSSKNPLEQTPYHLRANPLPSQTHYYLNRKPLIILGNPLHAGCLVTAGKPFTTFEAIPGNPLPHVRKP